MADIPQCPASYQITLAGYELTCTLTPKHHGLHVDPLGLLWAPATQEGYRRATEMR